MGRYRYSDALVIYTFINPKMSSIDDEYDVDACVLGLKPWPKDQETAPISDIGAKPAFGSSNPWGDEELVKAIHNLKIESQETLRQTGLKSIGHHPFLDTDSWLNDTIESFGQHEFNGDRDKIHRYSHCVFHLQQLYASVYEEFRFGSTEGEEDWNGLYSFVEVAFHYTLQLQRMHDSRNTGYHKQQLFNKLQEIRSTASNLLDKARSLGKD